MHALEIAQTELGFSIALLTSDAEPCDDDANDDDEEEMIVGESAVGIACLVEL